MKKIYVCIFFTLLAFINTSYCVPQKLEDIILRKREFQIDTVFSYNNISFTNLDKKEVTTQDTLYYVINLRYDITERFEIFLFGSYFSTFIKNFKHEDIKLEKGSFNSLGPAGGGVSVKLKKEGKLPGILISMVANIYDRLLLGGKEVSSWFDSYSFYISTFYTIDPVVLFLTSMFRYNTSVNFEGKNVDYGNTFYISPQFYFLANPFLSINAGFRYIYQGKDQIDDKVLMFERNLVGFILGLNYEITTGVILSIDGEFRSRADYNQNIINTRITFRF